MGRKSKIDKSQYRKEIVKKIREGISPRTISKWLQEKGEKISRKAIERYRQNNIPEVQILHPSVLQKRLNGLDIKIDELKTMQELMCVQLLRIDKDINREEDNDKLLMSASKEIDRMWGFLLDSIKIKQDLGILPGKEAPSGVNIYNTNAVEVKSEPTLRELLANVEPERRRNLLGNIKNAIITVVEGDERT